MIQYFQLTPDILLEYIYNDDPKLNGCNIKDICSDDYSTMLLSSNAFGSKYLCFKNESEGLDSISNLVLPLNNTETQFVISKSEYQNFFSPMNASNMFSLKNSMSYIYENTYYDADIIKNGICKVKYDKCIVHFTGKNFFGIYDSLIFQAYVYMSNKSKLYLSSFLLKKTSNLEIKGEHMLYNGKLYTTQIEFDIPSTYAIINNYNIDFNNALRSKNIELLQNTPIGINIYGVISSVKGVDNYVRLKTNKINYIAIPCTYNRLDEIQVNIKEAEDGDYFYIEPKINSNYSSFVDYIESMGEDIRSYVVMHELYLKEDWIDNDGLLASEITHKEFHIIDIDVDDEDEDISKRFDAKIKYRPICIKSGKGYIATIIDIIKIMNTVDGTSYEINGSLQIDNPYKYGKRLKRLDIKNESRPIVNVYNKKISEDSNRNMIDLNRSGGFVIENHTNNITSFIECTNIGVSIVEISPDSIY